MVKINSPDVQLRLSYVTKYSALFPSPWHTINSGLPLGGSSGAKYFPNLYPEDVHNYIRRNKLFFDGKDYPQSWIER
ncbi:MAG: hypothetical protein RMZ43_010145 [Nostoc sp. CmiVER01]|uniref:hypothetical protein n=1 Tax=Nostoc sp. CmiVER01 TaxID=3075384 RepID=UPI002AD409E0|nr:hypothetical protein [Nostoc sp. CmiVER01]MDZ8122177.1 hypothetical protein [Nostoc sp. CmiVER01]